MITQYFKLSWRNLLKNRQFSALNILGLSSGLAIALLLILYIRDEKSFDQYHKNADKIQRVCLTLNYDGEEKKVTTAPNVIGPVAMENISGIEDQVRILNHNFGDIAFINSGEKQISTQHLVWADPSILNIFDIPLIHGTKKDVLNAPGKAILSEEMAKTIFGDEDPMGKKIKIDQFLDVEITGIYRDFPENSSMNPEIIGSFNSMEWASKELVWSNASFETYLLLKDGKDPLELEEQIQGLVERNVAEENRYYSIWLQSLNDVHLHSTEMQSSGAVVASKIGDSSQINLLLILALIILGIAATNYMNLSTARSLAQSKEVGINKAIGAHRSHLITRYYVETFLLVTISMVIAAFLIIAILPIFNQIVDKQLNIRDIFNPGILAAAAGVGSILTLLSGLYPALYLSGFQPKFLLNTSFRKQSSAGNFRKALVITQFSASVVLIVGTIVCYKQVQYIQDKNLGFNPDQVIAISTAAAEDIGQIESLREGISSIASVQEVARAQTYPGKGGSGRSIHMPGYEDRVTAITTNQVTPEITDVLDMQLIAGQTLPQRSDKDDPFCSVILNQKAIEFLGYTAEEAIGKEAPGMFNKPAIIVGVVSDFHFNSLHQPIGAYAFHNNFTEGRPYMLVKANTENTSELLSQLETTFKKSLPQSAFVYEFVSQQIDQLYASEKRTSKVVLLFSVLAILVACLGLFGLAAFTSEQRRKEIGIRKVLGASVGGLVQLLSIDFVRLVFIAILISVPLSWWLMHSWLENYAYKIELSWWYFAFAGLITLLIAIQTVSFQAIRAAISNPVKSLRTE
jgi:putative ABC transport system permease protein